PPLVGDVAHACLPDLAVVDRGRAPQLDALLIGGEPQLRHVVLPADGGGEAAGGGVEDLERGAVALAPDEALAGGRHELAVFADEGTVGTEVHGGAVEGAAVPFDDAD